MVFIALLASEGRIAVVKAEVGTFGLNPRPPFHYIPTLFVRVFIQQPPFCGDASVRGIQQRNNEGVDGEPARRAVTTLREKN